MSEWKPISTAPTKQAILVSDGDNVAASINTYGLWLVTAVEFQPSDERGEFEIDIRPTHWMPLPDPPKGTGHE